MTIENSRITCEDLAFLIQEQSQFQSQQQQQEEREKSSNLLLLDLRSFLSYNGAHIRNSINVSIPKTLVKRDGFCAKTIERGICKKCDKEAFKNRENSVIVLYDQLGQDKDVNGIVMKAFDILNNEGLAKEVYYLEGGFTEFQSNFEFLVEITKQSSIPKPLNLLKPISMSAPALITTPEATIVQVTDYLYLSGAQAADDLECLKKNNISCIVNAAAEIRNSFDKTGDFVYKRLDLIDNPNQKMCIKGVLENTCNFIDAARESNQKVLVHCQAGKSRSVTIVLAYLMKTFHWTLKEAYDYLQRKNPNISPNLGFMGQLLHYESQLRGECSSSTDSLQEFFSHSLKTNSYHNPLPYKVEVQSPV